MEVSGVKLHHCHSQEVPFVFFPGPGRRISKTKSDLQNHQQDAGRLDFLEFPSVDLSEKVVCCVPVWSFVFRKTVCKKKWSGRSYEEAKACDSTVPWKQRSCHLLDVINWVQQ